MWEKVNNPEMWDGFTGCILACCRVVFIVRRHMDGESVDSLANRYNLEPDIIRQILASEDAKHIREYARSN